MNVYGYTFAYLWNGKYSKQYKTYIGCYKAARKLVPFDTDRIIYKIKDGWITPLL